MTKYQISIKAIAEDGTQKEIFNKADGLMKGVAMVTISEDEKIVGEVLTGMSMIDLSAAIASTKKIRFAAKMASMMAEMHREDVIDMEDDLRDLLGGGLQ